MIMLMNYLNLGSGEKDLDINKDLSNNKVIRIYIFVLVLKTK